MFSIFHFWLQKSEFIALVGMTGEIVDKNESGKSNSEH